MVENLEMLAFTKKCEFSVVKQLFDNFSVPYQIDEEVQNGIKFYEILYNLEDCENSCDDDTLLSVCYEIEKHNFEDKEDLREYIIATLGGDDEDTYRLDLECFFEGLAFEHFKSEEEYDKIMQSRR